MAYLQGFLIKQEGKCSQCGADYGPADTVQSTNVSCNRCRKTVVVCRKCKAKGCKCGGRLLDAWEKMPDTMS